MKASKILFSALFSIIILSISSYSFAMGNGQGKGQGQRLQDGTGGGNSNHEIVDTNNNGIADGQEDWDNDGILNKDDDDYEKSNINMRDDDGDGIPNKDDEDYEKPQDGTGNQNRNSMKNGSGSINASGAVNRQGKMNRIQSKYIDNTKKQKYKNLIQSKYKTTIDALSIDKLEALVTKIDELELKIEDSSIYTEDKKESFINILEAFREVIVEKLDDDGINIDNLLQ